MNTMYNNYRGRLLQSYIINAPNSIMIPWNMFKGFLDENTIKKITFYKGSVPTELFSHCSRMQIENKYGGLAKDRPSRTFWYSFLADLYQEGFLQK